ncbi:MAG: hypothetical protein J5715_03970 [Clostridiales bacterium]|nr:hypothetical protein [Clostridiales bacterium]
MFKNSKVYDILKWITSVLLPASLALYLALADIWSWPMAPAVGASVGAIIAFLGTILGISSLKYAKGTKNEKADGE